MSHPLKYLTTKKLFWLITLTIIICIYPQTTNAQSYRAFHWAFPFNNGLDFSSGSPVNDTSACPSNANGGLTQGTSAMCDAQGNLLLYCNGDSAWNGQHDVIQGGAGLAGSEEATQSSIIVPFPSNPDRYYIFTMDDNGTGNGLTAYLVDMSLNSGAGMVFPGTQLSTTMTEKVCAVKHANDYEYWVITHKFESDSFLVFHVDSFGLNNTPIVSSLGQVHSGNSNAPMGQMKVSPDGSRIAIAGFQGGHIELFSFNNETGIVSAPLMLENYNQNFPFGVEFSPDSRKLFYSQRFSSNPSARLYQYDLDNLDTNCLLNSKIEVAALDENAVPSQLQLATNGKIYLTLNYAYFYDTLAVINHPNLYGPDADYQQHGLKVDSTITEGLPNFVCTYLSDGIHVVFGTTCEGSATQMFPEDSIGLDSVRWDFGDGSIQSTALEASHTYSQNDTFLITLYAYRGNDIDTFHRNVIIWDVDRHHLGNDTSICGANPLTLDGSWYNACIEWSTGATTDTISISSAGDYWVDVYYQSCYWRDTINVEAVSGPPEFTLGNDTSVCNVFDFEIDPNLPNAYYVWQDGSNDTTYTVASTGIYALTATNSCGSTSDSLVVTVNTTAQPVLDFPDDTTICESTGLTLDVTFDDASYLWSDGSVNPVKTITTAGLYWVRVSNICDTVSDTLVVYFDPEIISNLTPSALLCDDGDTTSLMATTNGDTALWNDGTTASSISVSTEGIYYYTIENSCGVFTDTAQITKWDTTFSIDIGPDTVFCTENERLEPSINTNGFQFQILWSNGSKDTTTQLGYGVHSVELRNECAVISDQVRILEPEPIVIEPIDDLSICENENQTVRIIGESVQKVTWSDGQEGQSIIASEVTTYIATIIDTNGCAQSDSITFNDLCPLIVFSGNVFTPNKDGFNDEFCATGENASSLNLVIFNRWGTRVFEVSGKQLACWDGALSGNLASSGVYYYILTAEGLQNQSQTFRGSFTLLR